MEYDYQGSRFDYHSAVFQDVSCEYEGEQIYRITIYGASENGVEKVAIFDADFNSQSVERTLRIWGFRTRHVYARQEIANRLGDYDGLILDIMRTKIPNN